MAADPALLVIYKCRSVDEALRALRSTPVDVVLSDLYLSNDTTGLDLLARMREGGLTAPVIILSSDDNPAVVRQALALGISAYLTKHSEGSAIRQAVRWVAQPQNQDQVYLWPSSLRRSVFAEPQPTHTPPAVLTKLTRREIDVLRLFGQGAEPKEITGAFEPPLALPTVYSHLQNIRRKLDLSNEVELRSFGLRYLSGDSETGRVTSVRRPPSGRLVTNSVPLN
ncbi:hypothetical protein AWR27_14270 [Spirosoma montaniterrae]|uniref:Response regulatory domain-containing protein n=2 Tax=Spirosoma montaniterrae TaxID=1178516 RepID=A0A1P9WYE4_9BACT|nr:hypothetical protein AWR27_14270 [Spirosoma montaniterrae]